MSTFQKQYFWVFVIHKLQELKMNVEMSLLHSGLIQMDNKRIYSFLLDRYQLLTFISFLLLCIFFINSFGEILGILSLLGNWDINFLYLYPPASFPVFWDKSVNNTCIIWISVCYVVAIIVQWIYFVFLLIIKCNMFNNEPRQLLQAISQIIDNMDF